MMLLPRCGRLAGAAWAQAYHAGGHAPSRCVAAIRKNFRKIGAVREKYLRHVLDIGLGTVAASGRFGVPFAVGGLIFDRLGTAGHALFGGGALGSAKRCGMGRERLRKHAIHGVGPAAVMLNDLVGDVGHWGELASCWCGARRQGVNASPIL